MFPKDDLEEYVKENKKYRWWSLHWKIKNPHLCDIRYIYKYNDKLYAIKSFDHFNTLIYSVTLIEVKEI